ncbi:DUF3221 domain-containing protein [Ktedonobacter sp. SOSP1-85]|uniref:DUF3221 domain-containing protein n=1 Tax=Ktedonobacter sp. SOSP1-85 TaxID=2778367 RepID=UPI0035ADDB4B
MQQGTACHTAQRRSLSDLKVGQKVKVWSSSGITTLSYPGQLQDVTDVVIFEGRAAAFPSPSGRG